MYASILAALLVPNAAASDTALVVTVPSFPAVVTQSTATVFPLEEWRGKRFESATITLDSPFGFEALAERADLDALAKGRDVQVNAAATGALSSFALAASSSAPVAAGAAPTLSGEALAAMLQTLELQLLPSDAARTITVTFREQGASSDTVLSVPLTVQVAAPASWEVYGVAMPDSSAQTASVAVGESIGAMATLAYATGTVSEISFVQLDKDPSDVLLNWNEDYSSKPQPGLQQALHGLRGATLELGSSRRARRLAVRATIVTDGAQSRYDIGYLDVYPDLPSIPASCLVVAPYRSGKGLTVLPGPASSKVARGEDVVAGAVVRARYRGLDAECSPHLRRNQDYALRLSVTPRPVSGNERLQPCAGTGACADGNAVQSPLVDLGETTRIDYPFLSAWQRFAEDPTAGLEEGMNTLYAHVELVTRDGSNARVIAANEPVSLLVDSDELFKFEVVTHPAATNVAFLQCRDVLGDSASENDGSAAAQHCLDMPGGTVLSESVSVIPVGLHFRWSPFYQRPWLGFGADVGFLALGTSGFITGASTGSTGLNSLVSGMIGVDLQANGNDSVATRLNFLIGPGITVLQGRDGTYPRPYLGLTITTPILSPKDGKAEAASPPSPSPAPSPN